MRFWTLFKPVSLAFSSADLPREGENQTGVQPSVDTQKAFSLLLGGVGVLAPREASLAGGAGVPHYCSPAQPPLTLCGKLLPFPSNSPVAWFLDMSLINMESACKCFSPFLTPPPALCSGKLDVPLFSQVRVGSPATLLDASLPLSLASALLVPFGLRLLGLFCPVDIH